MNHLASQRASLPVLGILESHPLGLKASPNTADRVVVVVQLLSRVWLFVTPWTAARQAPYPPPSPRVCSNSCTLSQWWYLTISSSVDPSFCLQSFPAPKSFSMCRLFISCGRSIPQNTELFNSGYQFTMQKIFLLLLFLAISFQFLSICEVWNYTLYCFKFTVNYYLIMR